MKSIELFSGAGGLAKGLELAGFEHLSFVESHRDACQTLRTNFDASKVFEGDIRDYDFSTLNGVDLVAGGPPCQPFSLGGAHKASDDLRDMFPYALDAITTLRPKAFIFENVKGLLRPNFSEYFEYIILRFKYPSCQDQSCQGWREHLVKLKEIEKSAHPEYAVQHRLINVADYGIPQTRERVIFVGLRTDVDTEWAFPEMDCSLDRLLWDQYVSGDYWARHDIPPPPQETHAPYILRRIEKVRQKYGLIAPPEKPWVTMRDVLGHLPEPNRAHDIVDHVFRGGARSYHGHTGSLYDLPSKTIKAGVHGIPGGENMIRFSDQTIRYLTIHEAKLIQGFPDDFSIHGAWGEAMRQIGNAVPVPLGHKIGCEVLIRITSRER